MMAGGSSTKKQRKAYSEDGDEAAAPDFGMQGDEDEGEEDYSDDYMKGDGVLESG